MQSLKTIILEKLKLHADSDFIDPTKIYGDGEIKRFAECSLPFEDQLESYQVDQIREYIRRRGIDVNTVVYVLGGEGNRLSHYTCLSDKFKNAIRTCPSSKIETISDFEPNANIRIYKINIDNEEKLVIQCQSWEDFPVKPAKTYWYIKL